MISWRWKVATAFVALVMMGVVLLWPETALSHGHGSCATSCRTQDPSWIPGFPNNAGDLEVGDRYTLAGASGPWYFTGWDVYVGSSWTGSTRLVSLWRSDTGELLAQGTMNISGGAGWKQLSIAPVAVPSDVELYATFDTEGGHYGGFTNGSAMPSGVTRHGGRYRSPGGSFPGSGGTSDTGSFFVGIILTTTAPTATPTPTPAIVHQVISDGTTILKEEAVHPGTSRGNVVRVMNSGSITHIRIGRATDQSATVQWAIYPFGVSAPLAQGTAAGLSLGWNTIDIPDIPISAGFYVPTFYQQAFDEFGYVTAMTCPSGEGNNTGSTQIYYAGPCGRYQASGSLTYPVQVEGANLMYAIDMRVNAPASTSATATPWATATPFPAAGTATPAPTVTQFNNPDLVGAVNRLGDILQRVGDQITAAILVHGVVQAMTTMLDRLNDLIYQLTQIPLLLAASVSNVLALPSPEYFDTQNAELDVLIDAKTGGLGGIIEHLDFVEDLLEPECVGWAGVEFTLPNPRPGEAAMAVAFPPGNLWDNIYCPYIRPWLSLSLNFVFLFVAWRNGLKIFRLKG